MKTKELKPPQELVDAINESDDMTAPRDADISTEFGVDVPRQERVRLVHEEPQKLDHPASKEGEHPTAEDKKLKYQEVQHMMNKEKQYDRSHPGAGKAGKGDQAIDSAVGIDRFARQSRATGPRGS